MGKKTAHLKKPSSRLEQLNFLVGKWHTEGDILKSSSDPSTNIKGMDTYEWINCNRCSKSLFV
ncbi:MAG: hypothetical protein ABI528_07205 [bacterium]